MFDHRSRPSSARLAQCWKERPHKRKVNGSTPLSRAKEDEVKKAKFQVRIIVVKIGPKRSMICKIKRVK